MTSGFYFLFRDQRQREGDGGKKGGRERVSL
jgi:hypothetical protein